MIALLPPIPPPPSPPRRVALVLVAELRGWRGRPWAVVALLLPPVLLAAVLAVLALNVTREPVALVVEDAGPAARRLAALIAADTDAYVLSVVDAAQARTLTRRQQVAAVITIPAGFSAAVAAGHGVVRLDLDNVDIDVADDCRRSLDRSVGAFDGLAIAPDTDDGPSPLLQDPTPIAVVSSSPYGIGIDEQDLHRTTVGFLPYELTPVAAIAALSLSLIATALATASGRARGMDRILRAAAGARVVPVARVLLGAAAGLVGWCLGLAAVLLLPGSGVVAAHLPVVVLTGMLLALLGAAAGVVLGRWLDARTLAVVAPALVVGVVFAGASIAPPSLLPGVLRWVATVDPAGAAIRCARAGLFYGSWDATPALGWLVGWTAVVVGIAVLPRRA